MSHGWTSPSAIDPTDFAQYFDPDPLAAVIVSDIDADIDESEVPLALATSIAAAANSLIIARGLVHNLDDLSRLKYVPNIAGAIVGRALLDRSVSIEEALALADAPLERQAEFT